MKSLNFCLTVVAVAAISIVGCKKEDMVNTTDYNQDKNQINEMISGFEIELLENQSNDFNNPNGSALFDENNLPDILQSMLAETPVIKVDGGRGNDSRNHNSGGGYGNYWGGKRGIEGNYGNKGNDHSYFNPNNQFIQALLSFDLTEEQIGKLRRIVQVYEDCHYSQTLSYKGGIEKLLQKVRVEKKQLQEMLDKNRISQAEFDKQTRKLMTDLKTEKDKMAVLYFQNIKSCISQFLSEIKSLLSSEQFKKLGSVYRKRKGNGVRT